MTKVPAYLSKMLTSERISIAKNLLNQKAELVSLDSVALDWATGGGIPVGELVLFWGKEGTGKSLNCMKLVAREQQKHPDKWAIWVDTEYAFDAGRAEMMGIDNERLIVIQSNTFEGAIAPVAKMEAEIHEHKNICAIVVDSIKGLQSVNSQHQMEEGKVESAANAYGGVAKSVNPALHLLLRLANECKILTLLTNHVSMNMDPMTAKYKPYTLSGGKQLQHLCSTIVFLDKPEGAKMNLIGEQKDNYGKEIKYGSLIRCTVNKSRRTVEGKRAEFAMNFETGAIEQKEEELFRLAKGLGVLWNIKATWGFRDPALGIKAVHEKGFVALLADSPKLFKEVFEDCCASKIISAVADTETLEMPLE